MISAILGILSGVAGALKDWADARMEKTNQDTGRALQRGDDASALSAEAQAVNDARATPSVVSKVSGGKGSGISGIISPDNFIDGCSAESIKAG